MPSTAVTLYDASGNPTQFVGNNNFGAIAVLSTTPTPLLQFPTLKYYLTAVTISVDPACKSAGGAIFLLTLNDSVDGQIFAWLPYFPATPTAPTIASVIELKTPPGFFYKASTANSILSAKLNANLTTSSFYITASYGTTTL